MTTAALEGYRDECIAALNSVDLEVVSSVVDVLLAARRTGHTVFIAGNGGSAATSSHMATDLMLGSQLSNPSLRVIALTDNQAIITATGNDLRFDEVFSRQVSKLAVEGDCLIAITASGNSPNIVRCIDVAKELGVTTIGFTGFDGGKVSGLVDLNVHVPTRIGAYGVVEDAHLAINHMITESLKAISNSGAETK